MAAANTIDIRNTTNTFTQVNKFIPTTGATVDGGSTPGTYDSTGNLTAGNGTINIPNGGLVVHGGIKGAKVYNAVWNDFVDRIPVDDDCILEYGKCYCFDGEKYTQTSSYMQGNIIGIHSDTFGFECGYKGKTKELSCSIAGFVLAYVDNDYKPGTPLTCAPNGFLTKISDEDKREYPERIVALYWKPESERYWGTINHKVLVKGRKWVKVRR